MRSERWRSVTIVLLLLALVGTDATAIVPCSESLLLVSASDLRDLNEILEFRVMTFNVLNLNMSTGRYIREIDAMFGERLSLVPGGGPRPKPEWQIDWIARTILNHAQRPEIVVMQEIEDSAQMTASEGLAKFCKERLNDAYRPLLIRGNDSRGIHIGMIVRKDLPLTFEYESHRGEMWLDPVSTVGQNGIETQVFSRDAIVVKAKNSAGEDLFGGVLVHFKSKRDRHNDPGSSIRRKAEADRTADLVIDLEKKMGPGYPVFVAGDFNGAPNFEPEFYDLWKRARLEDSLNLKSDATRKERVTTVSFPFEGIASQSQVDAILVNKSAAQYLTEARVLPFVDENGREMPLPKSKEERDSTRPSDHQPVLVTFQGRRGLFVSRRNTEQDMKNVKQGGDGTGPRMAQGGDGVGPRH